MTFYLHYFPCQFVDISLEIFIAIFLVSLLIYIDIFIFLYFSSKNVSGLPGQPQETGNILEGTEGVRVFAIHTEGLSSQLLYINMYILVNILI